MFEAVEADGFQRCGDTLLAFRAGDAAQDER